MVAIQVYHITWELRPEQKALIMQYTCMLRLDWEMMWLLKKQLDMVVSMQLQQHTEELRISLILWGQRVHVYKVIQRHQKTQSKV